MTTSLEKLKKKQSQIKAQIQKLEASEKHREKKQDTRRKILIGSYYLDKARKENTAEELYRCMDGYLTRDSDRSLFSSLPPINTAPGTVSVETTPSAAFTSVSSPTLSASSNTEGALINQQVAAEA